MAGAIHDLYVPASLRLDFLQEAHDIPISGHLGLDKTMERLSRVAYWPDMENSVRKYVRECQAFQTPIRTIFSRVDCRT